MARDRVRSRNRSRSMASKKETHGETCMCRRCRGRNEALEREKTNKFKSYAEYLSDENEV